MADIGWIMEPKIIVIANMNCLNNKSVFMFLQVVAEIITKSMFVQNIIISKMLLHEHCSANIIVCIQTTITMLSFFF